MIDLSDTYLDAINFLLEVMGSGPVDSVSGPITEQAPDVATAVARLNETSKTVQKRGWWFNRRIDELVAPDSDHFITLPVNCMKVTDYYSYANEVITLRGNRIFNNSTQSYKFNVPLRLTWVELLEWNELPTTVQDTIRYLAAMEICTVNLEDFNKSQMFQSKYEYCYMEMENEDNEVNQYNMLQTPHALHFRSGIRPHNLRSRRRY